MTHFGKHLLQSGIWLLASELLCLILAFSFAILGSHPVIQGIRLMFGITAHSLLIGSCAAKAAADDVARFRSANISVKPIKPLSIAIILTIPAAVTYIVLCANSESILMLNLFPLLNAPFIGIYQFLIGGTEPFSAISFVNRVLMAVPPLLTAAAYLLGYYSRYLPARAAISARSNRT